eukprot:CAMPEP_0174863158 /NCGR_PEP_ID=MMETSP1114-20130205/55622_1 /TAXON_ID=312471 /ORGANISM="Neobodo designis, Strain CCAP 1951/1" /LENGTH=92 /DNA_ID=CAMNT_0016098219 /DNA_START=172 /DNA_END=447 /DNA_ORIENTATION=-
MARLIAVALVCAALVVPTSIAHPAYQALIPNGARVYRNGLHWPMVGHLTPDRPGSRTATDTASFSHRMTGTDSKSETLSPRKTGTASATPTP